MFKGSFKVKERREKRKKGQRLGFKERRKEVKGLGFEERRKRSERVRVKGEEKKE